MKPGELVAGEVVVGDASAGSEVPRVRPGVEGSDRYDEAKPVGRGDLASAPVLGQGDRHLAVHKSGVGLYQGLGTKVVLFDPTETPTSQRWGVFSNQRLQSDVAGVSDQRGAHAGRQVGDPRTSLAHVGEGVGKSCPCVHLDRAAVPAGLPAAASARSACGAPRDSVDPRSSPSSPVRTSSSRPPATSIRTAAFCRQRSAVRRYASSSSRPMFSRNGSGVEDNPSIRHVEVRALPHESGPSSCARGSPHWVLLETKTSRRRNALRSCSRTQNVKLRLSTWSGSTKTERSQVGVTRVPGISSRPIRRRPSSVRTAASPPSTICPAGRPSNGSSRSLGRNNRTDR